MAPTLYLTVATIPPASECSSEAAVSLRATLGRCFPRPENEAYLDGLLHGMSRGLPRVALTRLTALSLLPPLLEAAGVEYHRLILSRDEHGRPCAANAPELDFNLSHSASHAACALLIGGGRVGVDIEEPLAPERAQKLLSRYATDRERSLFDLPDPQPWEGFVRVWTLREALAKQDGRGQPLTFDATAVPQGVRVHIGYLPDTGAALALCTPDGVSLADVCYTPGTLPVRWI